MKEEEIVTFTGRVLNEQQRLLLNAHVPITHEVMESMFLMRFLRTKKAFVPIGAKAFFIAASTRLYLEAAGHGGQRQRVLCALIAVHPAVNRAVGRNAQRQILGHHTADIAGNALHARL